MLPAKSAPTNALMVSRDEWGLIREQADVLVKSRLLPQGIDTPEKAIAIALKGREMGIPMMQAFSHISIINGRPCISAELMLGQIYKNCPGAKVEIVENTAEKAVVRAARPGHAPATFSFSMADATTAGLTGKGSWKQYPKTMLLWRAISMMARAVFPDAIMGASHTPEEMGAEVNEEGEVIVVQATSTPPPPPAPDPPPTGDEYTGQDARQKVQLLETMKAAKIPQKRWPDVSKAFVGQSMTQMDTFVEKCAKEIAEEQAAEDAFRYEQAESVQV